MSPEEGIKYQLSYCQHIFTHTNASTNKSQLPSTLGLSGANFNLNQILMVLFSIQENELCRKVMAIIYLTTTSSPSAPAGQPFEHILNLISPSVESKLVTCVILWLFTIPFFLFCFFYFNLTGCFILSLILPLQDLQLLCTQLSTGNPYNLYFPSLLEYQ